MCILDFSSSLAHEKLELLSFIVINFFDYKIYFLWNFLSSRSWLINAIHALYATSALIVRTPKTEAILNGIFNDGTERSSDHRMTEQNWTIESDVDLMQWATEIPSDWQLSGKCSAYLFGCSGHGELADAGKTYNDVTSSQNLS